ncbi:MAG: IclR family transcriptional regulator [Lachnotalea sp.]
MEDNKIDKNPIQSAERIFHVLETLAQMGPIGLMDLSNYLGLHKSTTHRLLMSLIWMGYARQDEDTQKYMLSYKIVGLSGQLLDKIDILPIAHSYMKQLAEQSQETVHLVQRNDNDMIYIDKVESKFSSIRMVSQIGLIHPMYCSGVGKAILATLTIEEITKIWNASDIEKKTEKTIVSLDEMFEVLDIVRERGYAMDDEENEMGVRCIAACIYDYRGKAKYAFSISAPISRMPDERIEELSHMVLKVKHDLSLALGYRVKE